MRTPVAALLLLILALDGGAQPVSPIVDTWVITGGGRAELVLHPDETFDLTFPGEPELDQTGSYELDGERVTFTDRGEGGPCQDARRGSYDMTFERASLLLQVMSDACEMRSFFLGFDLLSERKAAVLAADREDVSEEATAVMTDGNWPSFRGQDARGVADGQRLPDTWDGERGINILWKTEIPGLGHSSPVVWGDRVFVTSAISSDPDASFEPGLYGYTEWGDQSLHRWMVYALDKQTGRIVWEALAAEDTPIDKRHIKNTYASSTPVTDGRFIVAFFGSQGLYAFDMDGQRVWTKDLGRLDTGAYDLREYEWGTASSPIIFEDLVIVQCDTQGESFVLATDIHTGDTVWRTIRDELPSWSTPSIYRSGERPELITNASNFIRGYDARTGRELWRLGGSSKITAPTPVVTDDLIIVASGRRPEMPIFAIRPGAAGDITLSAQEPSNEFVAWHRTRRGPYMPTPVVYRGMLYSLNNTGILDAYAVDTGREIYRQRIAHAGFGFNASPVAADGKLYLAGEDGDIFVVRAGARFELLAKNPIGEPLMATPALSEGTMYVRGSRNLFAVGHN